jgi:hypothetical protein
MVLFIFATLLLIIVFQYFWQHRKFYKLYNKLPQVHSHLPIIGVGHKLFNLDTEKLFVALRLLTSPGPSPRRMNSGPMCLVVVDDAAQLQEVLNSKFCLDKGYFYKKFILKNGKIANKILLILINLVRKISTSFYAKLLKFLDKLF